MIAATTTNIIAACNKAGLTIPTETRTRLDELKGLRRAALEPEPGALVNAVAEAIINGRDPHTDAKVKDAHARHALATATNWSAGLTQYAEREAAEAIAAIAEDLFDGAANRVRIAGARLAEVTPALPEAPLHEQATEAIRRQSTAEAWRTASDTVAEIDRLITAQTLLLHDAIGSKLGPRQHDIYLRVPHANVDILDEIERARVHADTWTIAKTFNLEITGATLTDIYAMPKRIAEHRAHNVARANDAEAHAVRVRFGSVA